MLESRFTVDGTLISRLSRGSEKKVVQICDGCGKRTQTQWSNYLKSQELRNHSGETFCQPCAFRQTHASRRGKPNPKMSAFARTRTREQAASWKGGSYVDAHGYRLINVRSGKDGAASGWSNYRKEHIVFVEKDIGRRLIRGEIVHHIDGDRLNNLLTNLWLSDHAGHRDAHQSLQLLGYAMVKAGLLSFDKANGKYQVADVKLRELLEHPGEGNQQPSPNGDDREGSETRE